VDLHFAPLEQPPSLLLHLGLLWRLVSMDCLLEHFSTVPDEDTLLSCMHKQLGVRAERSRIARRGEEKDRRQKEAVEKKPVEGRRRIEHADDSASAEPPRLVVLLPRQTGLLERFWARDAGADGWPVGVSTLAPAFRTLIVVIDGLPETEETLWLRLLGRGATRQRAITQLLELPVEHPLRDVTVEILAQERIMLSQWADLPDDEREEIMQLSPVFEEFRQQERQKGKRDLALGILATRFGTVDEALREAVERLLGLPTPELTRLLLQASREELIAR
jgi:hypothetical protein